MNRLPSRLQAALRSSRVRRIALSIFLMWLVLVLGLCAAIVVYGNTDHAQTADVMIVLGAGLRPDNTPTEALNRRINYAADLWRRGLVSAIICTGGLPGRATRTEASVCGERLQILGVPESAIILEEHSRSTEENALEAQAIMQAHGWQTAIVVSDGYHLLRASWLFQKIGIEAYTSPVSFGAVNPLQLLVAMGREVVAFHWQALKELLNLPITYVPVL